MLGVSLAGGCATIPKLLDADQGARACLQMAEAYDDEDSLAAHRWAEQRLQLTWHFDVLDDAAASEALGVPVNGGEHAWVLALAVEVDALPAGARSVALHTPSLRHELEAIDPPADYDSAARDATLPEPPGLTPVQLPSDYQSTPFESPRPPPRVSYVPGSGREPLPAKMLRDSVAMMTLGLVKQPKAGPRLTDESRRKLRRWQKENRAAFDKWQAEDQAARDRVSAERNAARQHNEDVEKKRAQWQAAQKKAWDQLAQWPCEIESLAVGERCEGLVLWPAAAPPPVNVWLLASVDLATDDGDACTFTVGANTPAQPDARTAIAAFAQPAAQGDHARVTTVNPTPAWNP